MPSLIPDSELRVSYFRASGPGGQNVNKVATACQLRFDLRNSPSLSAEVKARLERLAGSRVTEDGILLIEAKRYRTQEANRQDALRRLEALIERAATPPKPRKATRPSAGAKAARVDEKKRRGAVKQTRRTAADDWE